MESERIEEYLEALYKRQGQGIPVSTSALAEDLGVSLPAVTDMLRHLKTLQLIDYQPNKGAVLTEQGTSKALAVIRRHRLWERFLTDVLGMNWDKVHDEACRLEHATSPDMEKKLSSILGDVNTCPHGHAIPDESGKINPVKTTSLSEFRPPVKVRILIVNNENTPLLKSIDKLGLRPGSIITLLKENKDGSLEIEYGKQRIVLDKQTATALSAEVTPDEDAEPEEEIPLGKLLPGEFALIKAYGGGRGSMGRCLSLGFTPGSVIKMMENYNRGPVLVKVRDTEVAVGRQLADKISVVRRGSAC